MTKSVFHRISSLNNNKNTGNSTGISEKLAKRLSGGISGGKKKTLANKNTSVFSRINSIDNNTTTSTTSAPTAKAKLAKKEKKFGSKNQHQVLIIPEKCLISLQNVHGSVTENDLKILLQQQFGIPKDQVIWAKVHDNNKNKFGGRQVDFAVQTKEQALMAVKKLNNCIINGEKVTAVISN